VNKKKLISVEIEESQLEALLKLLNPNLSLKEKVGTYEISLELLHSLITAYNNDSNPKTIQPVVLYAALQGILKHYEGFQFPVPNEIKVKNLDDYTEKIKLAPENIIAIVPFTKGRKKVIYVMDGLKIKPYFLNNAEYPFQKLCNYLDPLNRYLLNVSKDAIVNVTYYEIGKANYLNINIEPQKFKNLRRIKYSNEEQFNTRENIQKIKNGIKVRLSLHNFMIGYKSDFKL
jgi:hypothetical protein